MKYSSHSILGVLIGIFCIFICCLYIVDILMFDRLGIIRNGTPVAELLELVSNYYIILFYCFMMAIASGALIVGIFRRRPELMKTWIYCAVVGIINQCIRITICLLYHETSCLLFGLLFLIILIVFLYTIYTLYRDIQKANKEAIQTNLSWQSENNNNIIV